MQINKPYIKEFGLLLEVLKFLIRLLRYVRLNKIRDYFLKKRHSVILNKIKDIADSSLPNCNQENAIESDYIWTMWWHGEQHIPENIRACMNSVRKNINGHIVVITESNYSDYIDIDSVIISKFQSGHITITQMSDIIRTNLLYKYGGLWIDATILVTSNFEIPDKKRYWTWKEFNPDNDCISKARWCGGVTYMPKNYSLSYFFKKSFDMYWRTHDVLIDYFLIDYLTYYGLNHILQFKEDWERIPIQTGLFNFYTFTTLPYNEEQFKIKMKQSSMHYMPRRKVYYKETESHQKTMYSRILEIYIHS